MAYMTSDNLIDGRLIYTRKKTGKLIRLPLQPKAVEIIENYHTLKAVNELKNNRGLVFGNITLKYYF